MKSILFLATLGLVSTYPQEQSREGCEDQWHADGYCDDENNMAACDWDGGDCCNNDIPDYDIFCSECQCLGTNVDFELSDFSNSVVSTDTQEPTWEYCEIPELQG